MSARYPGNYDLYARQTPAQTLGPFFRQGLVRTRSVFASEALCADERDVFHQYLASESTPGERLRIEGVVYDGLEQPIPDAVVEIWQADAAGRYAHPVYEHAHPATVLGATASTGEGVAKGFLGFGRAPTDDAGRYFFETIKPGRVPGLGGSVQAPHINLVLGARGMSRFAFSRIYFPEDVELAQDPVLERVPAPRRRTLIAERRAPGAPSAGLSATASPGVAAAVYVFDIHLQGERETVFFDF